LSLARSPAHLARQIRKDKEHIRMGTSKKSLSLPIADSLGVNVNESERERNGIIRAAILWRPTSRAYFSRCPDACLQAMKPNNPWQPVRDSKLL